MKCGMMTRKLGRYGIALSNYVSKAENWFFLVKKKYWTAYFHVCNTMKGWLHCAIVDQIKRFRVGEPREESKTLNRILSIVVYRASQWYHWLLAAEDGMRAGAHFTVSPLDWSWFVFVVCFCWGLVVVCSFCFFSDKTFPLIWLLSLPMTSSFQAQRLPLSSRWAQQSTKKKSFRAPFKLNVLFVPKLVQIWLDFSSASLLLVSSRCDRDRTNILRFPSNWSALLSLCCAIVLERPDSLVLTILAAGCEMNRFDQQDYDLPCFDIFDPFRRVWWELLPADFTCRCGQSDDVTLSA